MKNIFLIVIVLNMFSSAPAAVAQGIRVVYSMQLNNPSLSDLEPSIRAVVEAQLKTMNRNFVLLHHNGESLYFPDEASQSNAQTIQMGGGNVIIHKNLRDKQMVSQDNILDRQFLITEPLGQIQWKLSSEEKKVGNFVAKKATFEDNGITAWYCPEIPISDGPGKNWGLPGLILELHTQSQTIIVQEISLNYDTSGKIAAPTSGKSVSRPEFDEMRNQRLKELGVDGEQHGGGVRVIRM